jgi:hypothetical protein
MSSLILGLPRAIMTLSSRFKRLWCILVLCGTAAAQGQGNEGRSVRPSAKGTEQPAQTDNAVKDRAGAQIQKFARLIVGTWDFAGFSAPGAPVPRKDTGRAVIKFGPANRSLIEDFYSEGDTGKIDALGIFWWDDKAQGYRTMFCDPREPNGCTVYDGVGQWEGNTLVFDIVVQVRGIPAYIKEVISPSTPDSFTTVISQGKNTAELKPTYTMRHIRAPH